MPGSFGTQTSEDGVVAFTASSAHSGVFGRNEGTSSPPAGSAGGAGVFGLSVVPQAAGVFGANNHASQGVGVQGNGPEAGLSGFSEHGTGVRAHSNHGDAVQGFAHDSSRNGLLGHNNSTSAAPKSGPPAGNGVFGFTDVPNASGVCGAVGPSNTGGAGVTGIGTTAGRFFGDLVVTGNVNVAGNLTVAGNEIVASLQLISALQQQVSNLQAGLLALQGQLAIAEVRISALGG